MQTYVVDITVCDRDLPDGASFDDLIRDLERYAHVDQFDEWTARGLRFGRGLGFIRAMNIRTALRDLADIVDDILRDENLDLETTNFGVTLAIRDGSYEVEDSLPPPRERAPLRAEEPLSEGGEPEGGSAPGGQY